MTDALVPVPLVLDLWSLGHSASDIADRLAIPGGHKGVTRVVEHARQLGDKRAVYHQTSLRLIGKGIPARDRFLTPLQRTYGGVRIVALIRKPTLAICKRGHARTPDNVGKAKECLACKKLAHQIKRGRI